MVNKDISGNNMLPAPGAGTEGKIALFTIAMPESFLIEGAGFIQAGPLYVHAEAHCGGYFMVLSPVACLESPVKLAGIPLFWH